MRQGGRILDRERAEECPPRLDHVSVSFISVSSRGWRKTGRGRNRATGQWGGRRQEGERARGRKMAQEGDWAK